MRKRNMKGLCYPVFCLLMLSVLTACRKEWVSVIVSNDLPLERRQEIVEVPWEKVRAQLSDIVDGKVVVKDVFGKEIPSQIVYGGGNTPVALIFQATLPPSGEAMFRLEEATPQKYAARTYGRQVPERKDDFAWENEKVAFRVYGPALEATGEISNGIDVWVKSTGKLIIDEWYQKNDYHRDHGEGFDGYKVGRTLGAGAMAPIWDDKLVLGNNYTAVEILDQGPLRISFKLTYAPYRVGDREVKESRIFTLDAGSHFNRIEMFYDNAPEGMEVAAGIVQREIPENSEQHIPVTKEETDRACPFLYVSYWEPENKDNNMNNGHTGVAVLMPQGGKEWRLEDGHALLCADYRSGEPFVYYAGSGWSKGGVHSEEEWRALVDKAYQTLSHPLKVKLVRPVK